MGKKSIDGTGERFRQVANEFFDGNKSELARSLDMKPSSFAKYTDGSRRPGSKVLERLSRLGVNINWFLSGDGRMVDASFAERTSGSSSEEFFDSRVEGEVDPVEASEHSEERFFRIPIVQIQEDEDGRCRLTEREGVGGLKDSFIQQRYGVEPSRLRELRVAGNAMEETIRPGDRVLVEIEGDGSLVDGEICLVESPTGVLLRRIHLQGDTLGLVADNSTVPDQEVSREDWKEKYQLLARVLEVVRSL